MEYPEEIYQVFSDDMSGSGRRHAYQVGYEAGKAEQSDYIESMSSLESVLTDVEQLEGEDLPFVKRLIERTVRAVRAEQADPLAGYSNLTAAISAGEPIDWERLDGKRVQCVKPEVGTLRGKMDRDVRYYTDEPGGWWSSGMDSSYTTAFRSAWNDKYGWALWLEGEVPMRRKTADQLPDYTYFLGKSGDGETYLLYTGCPIRSGTIRNIYYAPEMKRSFTPASEWVVLEEYGPFQKPEGK